MSNKILRLLAAFAMLASPAAAQSPNNASVVVLVTDQTGAVLKDANVSIVNGRPAPSAKR